MEGYTGRLLEIDLTRRASRVRELDAKLTRDFLGGRGLGVRLLWEALTDPATPALSADNVVVFATGPLTGFPVPGASRTSLVTKSPATAPLDGPKGAATLAIGQLPGHFAVELKYAGYDAVVVRGRASEPVVVIIRDDAVEIRPAVHLWGREIPAAEQMLRDELPREPFQVVAIGPAGEALSPLATVVHSHPYASHAGRGGSGAVLGSKNLKAIAVRGTLEPFAPADYVRLDELSGTALANLRQWPQYETWRRYGTACLVEAGSDAGLLAVRNFREGSISGAARIGAVHAEASSWVRSEACYYCPLHCRKVALVRAGDGAGLAVAGPELETSVMLGANCGLGDLQEILRVKDRCDRLGLDPSSLGNVLGFLMEAAERGLVTGSSLGGVTPTWGDAAAMIALAERAAHPPGGDDLLAGSVRSIAARLGDDSQAWAMHVKGLEMDTYNVPALPAMAVAYGTSPVGAAHEMGHSVAVQDLRAVGDSLGLCRFHLYANPLEAQSAMLEAITGLQRSPAQLLAAGERIWNLERAFACRGGFGPADDRLPARCTSQAFTAGPRAGAALSAETETRLLTDYYAARGWDPVTGAPLAATLDRLRMDDVAVALKAG